MSDVYTRHFQPGKDVVKPQQGSSAGRESCCLRSDYVFSGPEMSLSADCVGARALMGFRRSNNLRSDDQGSKPGCGLFAVRLCFDKHERQSQQLAAPTFRDSSV